MSQPVALITGAASGIGAAVAVAFARKGVRVVGAIWQAARMILRTHNAGSRKPVPSV